MADIRFRVVVEATPLGAPKGELPFIEPEGRSVVSIVSASALSA
jgi:hypothetical protein